MKQHNKLRVIHSLVMAFAVVVNFFKCVYSLVPLLTLSRGAGCVEVLVSLALHHGPVVPQADSNPGRRRGRQILDTSFLSFYIDDSLLEESF